MAQAKLKIKKGDKVVVITGPYKGVSGEVLSVNPADSRLVVQGVNMMKRHRRASQTGPGGIEKSEASIHVSNVALADPKTGEATRVGYKILTDGRKVRFSKRTDEVIDG